MNAGFEKGRQGFADKLIDWDTDQIDAALLDLAIADVGIKAITGATNATPIVVTATAHGFANGDLVSIIGIVGNIAANGYFKIANQAANTFELTDPIDGTNVAGSGTYTSGGFATCFGPSAAGDFWDDFNGALIGSLVTLGTKTLTNGILDAADPVFTAVTGTARAVAYFLNTGTPSTSRMIAMHDGRQVVTCAATAATSATTIPVERLQSGIPNGTVLGFSNGQLATMTALAAAGDRTLTVSALSGSVTAGKRADAPITNAGFPVTVSGGQITVTLDATFGVMKL